MVNEAVKERRELLPFTAAILIYMTTVWLWDSCFGRKIFHTLFSFGCFFTYRKDEYVPSTVLDIYFICVKQSQWRVSAETICTFLVVSSSVEVTNGSKVI